MAQRPSYKVGNEFIHPRTVDVRRVKMRKLFRPAGRIVRRAVEPPVRIQFKPVKVTPTTKHSFIDSFAYDLLFISISAFLYGNIPYSDGLFLAYLLAALIFKISSERVFKSALFCLVLIPLSTFMHRQELANSFAIFTFYFLSIGVIKAIMELPKTSGKTL